MIRLLFSVFIVVTIFACENEHDDSLTVARNGTQNSQVQYDPYADMRLSQYPGHPNPPIYEITFPNGQKLLILGVVHGIPLECYFSITTAKSIIEASAFSVNEIKGIILPSMVDTSMVDNRSRFYMAAERCYMTTERIKKIKDSIIVEEFSKIFDSQGHWYEKAGIIANEAEKVDRDFCASLPSLQTINLKIKGKTVKVPAPNGQEIHPIALLPLLGNMNPAPAFKGVDEHLDFLTYNGKKAVYAFESHDDSMTNGFIQELANKIDARPGDAFLYGVNILKSDKEKYYNPLFYPENLYIFYSRELYFDQDPDVIERNGLWIQRLVKLNEEKFKLAFAHVGLFHLHDLFEKLKEVGFTVSERVSLAKLDEILLDEDCVVAEHKARKVAMKAAFGITYYPK